ncbi:MAG TPA: hypothetical protein DDW85_09580 [Porphyromonadaceae bacterium]|nr:hypothetical protein [Porphyromonadaceae bacterium]
MKPITATIRGIVILLLLVPAARTVAQENGVFTVKAQVRPRFEYNHGAQFPLGENDKPISFISNRTRVSLGYENSIILLPTKENWDLSMGISGQDISIWGQKPQVDNAANVTLNEAWAKLHKNGFFAQIGRQSLSYDDDRILGTLDWHQAGRWHDALRLGYENDRHTLHAIIAYNQTPQSPGDGTFYKGGQPYKTMQTAYYQFHNDVWKASALLMNLGFQHGDAENPKVHYLQTMGTHIVYTPGALSLTGSFYYQTGKTAADAHIGAYLFAAKAQYAFAPLFSAAVGVDYLSGNNTDEDNYTAFNPLYGTHHKFYGSMDYFYASAYPDYGLADVYASFIFKPVKKLTTDITYHYFSAQQPIRVNDTDRKALGSEIDLTVTYPVLPYVTLQGGFSVMFGTDAFFQAKGGSSNRTQHWTFLSLNINPTLFSSRK